MKKSIDQFNSFPFDHMLQSNKLHDVRFLEKLQKSIMRTTMPRFQDKLSNDGYYRSEYVPSDSLETLNKNLDEGKEDILRENGWIDRNGNVVPIDYRINSEGFRCDHFDDRDCIVTLGCSITYGIGLHEEDVWPSVVAKKLGLNCVNLGIPGRGLDFSTFYLITQILDKAPNIKGIAVLVPPPGRIDFWCTEADELKYASLRVLAEVNEKKYTGFSRVIQEGTDTTSLINTARNIETIKLFAESIKVPSVILPINCPSWIELGQVKDLARDLMHFGPIWQKHTANRFLDAFKDLGI